LNHARQALDQISLLTAQRSQCAREAENELSKLKNELELMYRPSANLVKTYWDTVEALPGGDCRH
jgi:hypothetical protein